MAGRPGGGGGTVQQEQRRWLDAIKDHIANSLSIEQDDLDERAVQPDRRAGAGLRTLRRPAAGHPG